MKVVIPNKNKYLNSPIAEAVIDIKIDPVLSCSSENLKEAASELSQKYPKIKEKWSFHTKFDLSKESLGDNKSTKGLLGFQFWSTDDKDIFQYKYDGMTFSRLKPYIDWETHYPEALKLWENYDKKLKPIRIKSIAVRYVNNIVLPDAKLNEYINNLPTAPAPFSGNNVYNNFLNRFSIDLEKNISCVVTLAKNNSDKNNVILDIDIIEVIDEGIDCDIIKAKLHGIHEKAEEVFESYITDNLRGVFKLI